MNIIKNINNISSCNVNNIELEMLILILISSLIIDVQSGLFKNVVHFYLIFAQYDR